MPATFVGVRHHSPACARLVAATIAAQRPAYVLVEGPADFNGRVNELLLGHELPIAIFSYYRDGKRANAAWSPLCAYSPEWVALTAAQQVGAEVKFIDLPAWHSALADRSNRYADAEQRYADAIDRLCRTFAVDNVDTLWDHLFEVPDDDGLAERLAAYFDLIRGEADADENDRAREAYMAEWVRAAVAQAGDRPVVVVTGGFHRPALVRLAADPASTVDWPALPALPDGALGGSYLVPYSFKRLDAFDGYQSGMPSPGYYQRVWQDGLEKAASGLVESVVARLRNRKQVVSTADLIAARATAGGLARLRGHRHPARTDVLDGLVAALVSNALDTPLPWTTRGHLATGTEPVVVEMVAALSGDQVGRLHPDSPLPPLVHDVTAELERHRLDVTGPLQLELTAEPDLARSQVLHRLRVLGIPGVRRDSGPDLGGAPLLDERWQLSPDADRLSALIEAGAYGATLVDAALAALDERVTGNDGDIGALAAVLFDAALCGLPDLSEKVRDAIARCVGRASELGPLGQALATVLGLWRHDRLLGSAHSPTLGALITSATTRVLWLAEGIHGGPAPANLGRVSALAAVRDALLHAGQELGLDREAPLALAHRLAVDQTVPPDLRGAALGFALSLGVAGEPSAAARGAARPEVLGDWLTGLFALARETLLAGDGEAGDPAGPTLLAVLDETISTMTEHDFLVALPALRQAFGFFPPRERETIARRLLDRRGVRASARDLLRVSVAPELLAQAAELEARVDELLAGEGLIDVEKSA